MSHGRYERPAPATVEEVLARAARGDTEGAASALVGATLSGSDPSRVEELCRDLLGGPDRTLAGVAATCLGHVARLERMLSDASINALLAASDDPDIGGPVDDALDDLETFTAFDRRR